MARRRSAFRKVEKQKLDPEQLDSDFRKEHQYFEVGTYVFSQFEIGRIVRFEPDIRGETLYFGELAIVEIDGEEHSCNQHWLREVSDKELVSWKAQKETENV